MCSPGSPYRQTSAEATGLPPIGPSARPNRTAAFSGLDIPPTDCTPLSSTVAVMTEYPGLRQSSLHSLCLGLGYANGRRVAAYPLCLRTRGTRTARFQDRNSSKTARRFSGSRVMATLRASRLYAASLGQSDTIFVRFRALRGLIADHAFSAVDIAGRRR